MRAPAKGSYAWTEEIIRDHLERDIPDIKEIIVISPTACLIFKGWCGAKEGFVNDDIPEILDRISGGRTWAGKDAVVMAVAVTLAESRHILAWARDFICSHRLPRLTAPKGLPTTKSGCPPPQPDTLAWSQGKVRRADKYFAKLLAKGTLHQAQQKGDEWVACLLHPQLIPSLPTSEGETEDDPYESACECASKVSDTSLYDASDSEEDSDDMVAYDTETSHHTVVADRNWQRKKQQQCWEHQERKKQRERRVHGTTLSLFKNSSKEGATRYIDWRNCVDELIQDRIGEDQVRSLVMQSLEGPPKNTAKLTYKKGKGSLLDVLKVLDKVYGQSVSYVHLQSELCNIQQMYKESAQDYFQHMVRLQVTIQDKYPTQLDDRELEHMAQEAYFNGLREEYKLRVVYITRTTRWRVSVLRIIGTWCPNLVLSSITSATCSSS